MLYCICIGLVELSVIVQVHHINNKYNNSCKGKWWTYTPNENNCRYRKLQCKGNEIQFLM